MIKWFYQHKKESILIMGTLGIMMMIRFYEKTIFYDPFISFFENDGLKYPDFDPYLLFTHLLLRFSMNSILSLSIIKLIFKEKILIKNLIVIYTFLFIIFISLYFLLLFISEDYKMILFYIRRILIQPILLLLFIPAFYYKFNIASTKK